MGVKNSSHLKIDKKHDLLTILFFQRTKTKGNFSCRAREVADDVS